ARSCLVQNELLLHGTTGIHYIYVHGSRQVVGHLEQEAIAYLARCDHQGCGSRGLSYTCRLRRGATGSTAHQFEPVEIPTRGIDRLDAEGLRSCCQRYLRTHGLEGLPACGVRQGGGGEHCTCCILHLELPGRSGGSHTEVHGKSSSRRSSD